MAQIHNPRTHSGCVGIQLTLASYYNKMKDPIKAEEYLDNALKLDPKNTEVLLLQAKVRKDKLLQQQVKKLKEKLVVPKHGKLNIKEAAKVERCNVSNLSIKEFLQRYAITGVPVIITDLVEQMTHPSWNIQYIRKIIGHKKVLHHPDSVTLATYIDSMQESKQTTSCTGWSLANIGAELTNSLSVPRYASDDFLQRTDEGPAYRDSWPCLSVTPRGMMTTMKVEPHGFHHWVALFEGRKRFTLIRREQVPCLYPYCDDNLNIMFNADIFKPDLKDFPLLSTITPLQCTLEAGEYLFIPENTAYCCETLDNSLTVSSNYVDLTNLQRVKEELQLLKMTDSNLEELYLQLTNETFPTNMYSLQSDLTYKEFKTWPRDKYTDYDISEGDL